MQLEELLEPYLKDTNIGLPYWDWTKNSKIPDLWEDIPSLVKKWNEKRNTDFDGFTPDNFEDLKRNCQAPPTMNIGEHTLRNKDLNVLSGQKEFLIDVTNDAMESDDFASFVENIEVKNKIIKVSKSSTLSYGHNHCQDSEQYLNQYFHLHVCPSFCLSVRPSHFSVSSH